MTTLGTGQVHFAFRSAPRFDLLHRFVGWRPDIDGIRIHDDGGLSITMGKRILTTTAANINGIEPVDDLVGLLHVGIRQWPLSRSVTFATDAGSGVALSFREPVAPAIGLLSHHRVVVTVERPQELLPAVLAARRSAEDSS
jgi:hypothetical protein